MKIVIDLDENVFVRLYDNGLDMSKNDINAVSKSIRNGKPIEDGRPILIYKGQIVYLTQEHIEVLAEWEKEEMKKEVLEEQFKRIFDGLADFDWHTEMRKDYKNVIADLKGKKL